METKKLNKKVLFIYSRANTGTHFSTDPTLTNTSVTVTGYPPLNK